MSEGLDYDRCPHDGCTEAEPYFKNGGTTIGSREEYRDWQIFRADPHKGGCGNSWSTATKQGLAARTAKGQPTRGLTRTAMVDAVHSLPSERFRENYSKIRWDK